MTIRFRGGEVPRAFVVAAWIRLFSPSSTPLLTRVVCQRSTPLQCSLIVFATRITGSRWLCVAQ